MKLQICHQFDHLLPHWHFYMSLLSASIWATIWASAVNQENTQCIFKKQNTERRGGRINEYFVRQSFRRKGGNNFNVMMLYCEGFGSLGLLPALSFLTEVGCFSLLEGAFLKSISNNLARYIDGRVIWSAWVYAKKAFVDSTGLDGQLT